MAQTEVFRSTKIKASTLSKLKMVKASEGTPVWMSIEKAVEHYFKTKQQKKS